LSWGRDIDLCSGYVWTSRTRGSLSELSGSSDVWSSRTRRSLSELSGSRDVDLCSRYVWTSRTRGSMFQLSGSRDVDLCSTYLWTSRTRGSLSALSGCWDVGWGRIWMKLTWVPYSRRSPPLIWGRGGSNDACTTTCPGGIAGFGTTILLLLFVSFNFRQLSLTSSTTASSISSR